MGTSSLRIAGRSWGRKAGGCFALASLFLITACGGSAHGTPTPSAAGGVWRQHVDAPHGFIIDYPDAWDIYQASDPGVFFLAGPHNDTQDFAEVRVISGLPVAFKPTDTQAMKQVVDELLANEPINILSSNQVSVNGLTGWQEVYTFQDPKLGVGAHVHVFLFQGTRLHTIVFQALPRSRFDKLAPTFQRMLNSYRALPIPSPSPGTSPTAAATPTPTP